MGAIVLLLRSLSHSVSFADKPFAGLTVGRLAGQVTFSGAYPPEGEFGSARGTAAYTSTEVSRAPESEFAGRKSVQARGDSRLDRVQGSAHRTERQ